MYFNHEQIQIRGVVLINAAYYLSVFYGSMVRSKSIGNNTYTGRRIDFRSKPTPIYWIDISHYKISYSIIHFSRLPQTFSKGLINRLSQKFIYASMMIDPVINVFSHNLAKIHLQICDHSIITLGKRVFCLGFSNTYHVYILDVFRTSVSYKVKFFRSILI